MENKSADVHFRVEPSLKKEVSRIAKKAGWSLPDAMRHYMILIKTTKKVPTMEDMYNDETLEAIRELETSKDLKTYASHEELLKELGIDG